ncbi:MAG: aminotransferase class IV, partial [Candidatus Subteraquimicrobiales bacterium]|nr:aminotransferase class IV [Candidatus Subteraquimicrobiales bacterium]
NRSGLTFLKSLNFLPNVLARGKAEEENALEAIFVKNGKATEGTVSNIFVVKNREIRTPPLENGILPGITRAFVLKLIKDLGMFSEEKSIKKEELLKADEVFLTNSVMEIMPVKTIDGKHMGEKVPGEVTSALMSRYRIAMQKILAS